MEHRAWLQKAPKKLQLLQQPKNVQLGAIAALQVLIFSGCVSQPTNTSENIITR
jgi:hypothetical protein